MSEAESKSSSSQTLPTQCRLVGGTELSWCKAIPGGTGITVLSLLLSKPPQVPHLLSSLHNLQLKFPILNSKLHFNPSTSTFSYVISPSPNLDIQLLDQPATAKIIQELVDRSPSDVPAASVTHFHLLLEHELNRNTWQNPSDVLAKDDVEQDVFYASLYELDDGKFVVALRVHTSVCDRTSAGTVLRELVGFMSKEGEVEKRGIGEVGSAVEDCIPSGKANKPFWARGVDILGYSFNGLRFSNLDFEDTVSKRCTKMIRFQLSSEETDGILSVSV